MKDWEHHFMAAIGHPRFMPQAANPMTGRNNKPYVINQIALNLFGDRYIIIYGNTIQFHNHCYHVRRICAPGHPHCGCYYLEDANTGLAMWSDVDFAPPGYYGVIFEPQTGEIIDCEPAQ